MFDLSIVFCVLTHPDQAARVVKDKIAGYDKGTGPLPDQYTIVFKMVGGAEIIWTFNSELERDAVMEKIDKEMKIKSMG